jgi:hypothetical protein
MVRLGDIITVVLTNAAVPIYTEAGIVCITYVIRLGANIMSSSTESKKELIFISSALGVQL